MSSNKKLIRNGLFYALGVVAYAAGISAIMSNTKDFSAPVPDMLIGAFVLSLICLSAATVGSLIFGRPVYLVITGEKKEGVMQLLYTLGWLFVLLVSGFAFTTLFLLK